MEEWSSGKSYFSTALFLVAWFAAVLIGLLSVIYYIYVIGGNQKVIPQIVPQSVEQIDVGIFSIPWGYHRYIIDKFFEFPEKALFFICQMIQNGWSRDIFLSN